jgi:hypothetical protein
MISVFLTVVIAMQAGDSQRSRITMSVCDVLTDDPTKLNGRVISVRGVLGATDEGMWLSGECKTHLVTKGLAWGNDLSVYVPAAEENVARSWDRLSDNLKRRHADIKRDRIWVTIVGRLETRKSIEDEVVQTPHGLSRAGFGHLGGSAAEINVISVEDVVVERRSQNKQHQ